jgi:hypothetical protein
MTLRKILMTAAFAAMTLAMPAHAGGSLADSRAAGRANLSGMSTGGYQRARAGLHGYSYRSTFTNGGSTKVSSPPAKSNFSNGGTVNSGPR